MDGEFVLLDVVVQLDAVPGVFHTKESAKETIQQILDAQLPHYKPQVFCCDPS